MNSGLLLAAIGAALICTAIAQQAPPRLQIPGAIPLGAFPVPDGRNFRNERVLPAPALQRVRRPQQSLKALAAQQPAPQQQPNYPTSAFAATAAEDAKPVNEDRDDEYQQPSFIPPNFQQHIQQQEQHLTESVSRAQQQQQNLDSLAIGGGRFAFAQQERQQPQQQQQPQHVVAQQQQQKQQAVRRPAFREASPAQYEAPQPQPIRRAQQGDTQQQQRPRNSQEHQQQSQEREQKPVAQILRKYREENEDGSITWGFENDDGSYKEEFIGVDCITRGRYGYVDPDGMKREYTYETGIACDPNKQNSEEDDIADGYIDYQNQEMVLANGDRIDLSNIGKNKGRKPQAGGNANGYRN